MKKEHKSFRRRTVSLFDVESKSGLTKNVTSSDESETLKFLIRAALIPTIGLLLYSITYMIGLSYHQAYLSEYGVPIDLFQKQPSDYFLYTYIATITALSNILDLITDYRIWLSLTGLIAATLLYILALLLISKSKRLEKKLEKLNKHKKTSIALVIAILSTSTSGLILSTPIAALLILALPVQLGGYSAKIVASKEKENFKLGCKPENNSKEYCYSLKDNYNTIKSGYIISISPNHIAIYNKGQSYIYPLTGKSLETSSTIE